MLVSVSFAVLKDLNVFVISFQQTVDEKFDREERRFKAMDESVTTLVGDISLCLIRLKVIILL